MNFIQVSDLHLNSGPGSDFKGVDSKKRLMDILNHAEANVEDLSLILMTGDLAHDEKLETYVWLRNALLACGKPFLLVPGNHDHLGNFTSVFGEVIETEDSWIFNHVTDGLHFIGLNSKMKGEVSGLLSAVSLEALSRLLDAQRDKMRIICLHHPPILTGDKVSDEIGLRNRDAFWGALGEDFSGTVIFGHLHREIETTFNKARVYGCPSTALGYEGDEMGLKIDLDAWGYRRFSWDAQKGLESMVVWMGSSRLVSPLR